MVELGLRVRLAGFHRHVMIMMRTVTARLITTLRITVMLVLRCALQSCSEAKLVFGIGVGSGV